MYDYDAEIRANHKAAQKRWNGKVITTSNQWRFNDNGSLTVTDYSEAKLWDAVREHKQNEAWC
jgi:hypothetical protein